MTNEELATAIKDGNTALYADLWEQVKRFVWKKASLFYLFKKDVCTRHGVTLEDLNQCGYFSLVDAVKAWTPESGFKVTSYLNLHLKRHFNAALSGGRVRNTTDCLDCCESLDKPMGDDLEGLSLEDAIPDPAAEQDVEDAENRVFFGELREEMKRCLSSIDQEQANILRMQFFEGKTQGEIAERIGKSCQRVHQIKSKGLRELRKPQYSRSCCLMRNIWICWHGSQQACTLSDKIAFLLLNWLWKGWKDNPIYKTIATGYNSAAFCLF